MPCVFEWNLGWGGPGPRGYCGYNREAPLPLGPWQLAPHTWKAISSGFVEGTRCASWRLLPAACDLMPLLRGSPPGASLAYVVLGVCRPDANRSAAQSYRPFAEGNSILVPFHDSEGLCPMWVVQEDVCDSGIRRVKGDRVNGGSLLRHGNLGMVLVHGA